jgi:hypothetical protein
MAAPGVTGSIPDCIKIVSLFESGVVFIFPGQIAGSVHVKPNTEGPVHRQLVVDVVTLRKAE